ncbi:hypothetical protein CISG_02958 [Coccidioides immitis RMSCC 3703]|uniref:Uncharacterized protein n=1 Tax=Coccidioides immitis RMSCC 3703 TaxID=454286 RepID=A0A0J8QIW2_COCIT|nr:hypothetical protein CISG_02958 [Coccidioides immitis RMSCC 3703]
MDAWDLRAANDQRREGLPRAAWVVVFLGELPTSRATSDETAPHLDGPKRIKGRSRILRLTNGCSPWMQAAWGCDFILTKLRCNREMNCHLSSPLNKTRRKVESQASSAQRFNIRYHLRPGEGSTL